jgi:hypothetical protein
MAEQEYEDLDETLDRGDSYEEDDYEDQDESVDEEDQEDDDEPSDSDIDLDEEEEEEAVEAKKEIKIPKSRFDEVIAQREEAKERSLWLEGQLEKLINSQQSQKPVEPEKPQLPEYNFDEAEERYVNLIIEGEIAKATKLRSEIDKVRQENLRAIISEITESVTSKVKSESSAVLDEEKFNNLIENFENKYKFLDTTSDDYNEEAVDTVNTLLAGYVAAGKNKAEGLRLAVNKVAPLYDKVKEVKDSKQSLGNKRKVEAGKKAAQAANSQPSKTKSVSTRSVDKETVNVSKMSEKDFNQLTEKEKRILRGD